MRVAVTGETPYKETYAREDQDPTDEMTLLRLDLFLELQTDQRDNGSHRKRSENVAGRGQPADTS